jgi:5-methylcytosine-specific restriction endonuclease McrA
VLISSHLTFWTVEQILSITMKMLDATVVHGGYWHRLNMVLKMTPLLQSTGINTRDGGRCVVCGTHLSLQYCHIIPQGEDRTVRHALWF